MAKKKNNVWIIIIIILVVLILGRNILAKYVVQAGVKAITGLDLKVDHLKLGLFSTNIDIKNMRLYNPKGFEEKTMVEIPKIIIDYDVMPLFKGKVKFSNIDIYLKELTVVKNKDGKINLDTLKEVSAKSSSDESTKTTPKENPKEKKKNIDLRIDQLVLRVDQVVYVDHTKEGEPSVKTMKVNLNDTFKNIDNPAVLVSLIVMKTLAGTTIGNIVNFDVDLSRVSTAVTDTLKSSKDATKKAIGTTTETLKDKTKGLKGLMDKF